MAILGSMPRPTSDASEGFNIILHSANFIAHRTGGIYYKHNIDRSALRDGDHIVIVGIRRYRQNRQA